MKRTNEKRLIVGISGASGIQYGVRLLEILRPLPIEVHLVMSRSARLVRRYELPALLTDISILAHKVYAFQDISCAIASGSFKTIGMIIAPCSMNTLAEIANGFGSNALTRAADVTLKERRKLVLMTRESPLNASHLENMVKVTHMGGIIAPPTPAFYNNPKTLDDLINHSVGRILDLFDIDTGIVQRWE